MNTPSRARDARYRRNPDEGGSNATTVVLAVGGIAALGVVGYLIYRATRPQVGAPAPQPVLGGGPPSPAPQPSTTAPTVTPSRISLARTTPAASFLVVRDREEDLTPDQLANWAAANKVIVEHVRSRNMASGLPPNEFTGEFRHDIELWDNSGSGQGPIRRGEIRYGRFDRLIQEDWRQSLAEAQEALANGDWNRPWPT